MSMSPSSLNWWYMLGSLRLMCASAFESFFVIHAMSRNTPPCGLPRAAFAAHAFGDEDALHAGRPDHAGRMELDELHVHQLGARLIRERVAVAGAFPGIARDLVRAPGAPRGEHDGARGEHLEPPALPLVADDARGAAVRDEQRHDRELHVHVDAAVDPVVLERAD